MRIFAGPNGSGKTTIYNYVSDNYPTGIFVNPDDIDRRVTADGRVSLRSFGIRNSEGTVEEFLVASSWWRTDRVKDLRDRIAVEAGPAIVVSDPTSGYEGAVIADLIRALLLHNDRPFAFETVMSHPSKIDFMREANSAGYKCYLYYVCTVDPRINAARVETRVKGGGHPVPEDAIVSRYRRSLELLPQAVDEAYRAFLFDNSGDADTTPETDATGLLVLEYEKGQLRDKYRSDLPNWVRTYAPGI